MTTSKCYVWKWLLGATDPVVAGELQFDANGRQRFVYGRSYLERANAEPIYESELPLRPGGHEPVSGLDHFSCLRDAAPDAWGRRVIENRLFGRGALYTGGGVDEAMYALMPPPSSDYQKRRQEVSWRFRSAELRNTSIASARKSR
jgi:hypothetical protein